MSRKILVTGGNGFIGRHVVDTCLRRGYTPVVLDRQWGAQQQPAGVEIIGGDIRDASTVTEAMAHAEGFIHLAGVLGTAETINNPRPAAEVNIVGGLNVLEAAAQYKVHGVNIAVGNHWMNNTYSITKSTVERFAAMYRKERDVQVSTVRALNAYGEGQSSAAPHGPSKVRKIMPSFVNRALDGDSIEVYGSGEQVMDMIYVGDVAKIMVSALEHSWEHGACHDVLEAGTGRRTTVAQIAQMVLDEVGSGKGITYLPMRGGEPVDSVVVGDPRTLRWGIGYGDPLVRLEDGISRTVSWFKAQRQQDSRFNAGVGMQDERQGRA